MYPWNVETAQSKSNNGRDRVRKRGEHLTCCLQGSCLKGIAPHLGDHWDGTTFDPSSAGSSRHAPGALRVLHQIRSRGGIIPACAGSTRVVRGEISYRRDHPGMRREHGRDHRDVRRGQGSSRHAPGARIVEVRPAGRLGIIPPCAGSTIVVIAMQRVHGDHPGMRREHPVTVTLSGPAVGSSRHAPGAPISTLTDSHEWGIIPACARSTPPGAESATQSWDHPGMRREHPEAADGCTTVTGSSRHAPGAPHDGLRAAVYPGIIPACAGSTSPIMQPCGPSGDHPGMRREHTKITRLSSAA